MIVSFFFRHFPHERESHVCNEPALHLTLSILFNLGRSVSTYDVHTKSYDISFDLGDLEGDESVSQALLNT